jgi:crossover junction endodeoxyribonuclease RuvC
MTDTPPPILGLDISLASTGIASTRGWTRTAGVPRVRVPRGQRVPTDQRARRIHAASHAITDAIPLIPIPALVVIEKQFTNGNAGEHDLIATWWRVVGHLVRAEVPVAVVQQATLKLYATGNGAARKTAKAEMVAQARQEFDWFNGGHDEADALWLAAMGAQRLGRPITTARPAKLLTAVEWPPADSLGAA